MRDRATMGRWLLLAALLLPYPARAADGDVAPAVVAGSPTALGLLAFNSPYIFGSAARHDGITCDGCHSPTGLHGKAASLSFRKTPVSILAMHVGDSGKVVARDRAPKVLRHIIVDEFEARDVDPAIVDGLTDLLARDAATLGRLLARYRAPAPLLRLAVARIAADVAAKADDRIVGFEILTARFLCSQLAAGTSPQHVRAAEWNRVLADADADILADRKSEAVARLRRLRERIMAAR